MRLKYILSCALLAASASIALDIGGVDDDDAQLSEMIPSFKHPLELTEVMRWRDGGSLGFVVHDASTNKLSFCYNARIDSSDIGFLFIGATHATQKHAKKVTSRKTENALLRILQIWVNQNVNQNRQKELKQLDVVNDLSRTEFDAWTILHFLKSFDAVRNARQKKANKTN